MFRAGSQVSRYEWILTAWHILSYIMIWAIRPMTHLPTKFHWDIFKNERILTPVYKVNTNYGWYYLWQYNCIASLINNYIHSGSHNWSPWTTDWYINGVWNETCKSVALDAWLAAHSLEHWCQAGFSKMGMKSRHLVTCWIDTCTYIRT